MSHTVHPYAHRLGILRDWKSRWFGNNKKYRTFLKTDILVTDFLDKKLEGMHVAEINVERSKNIFKIIIKTSRPGLVIGRNGEGMDKIKKQLNSFMQKNGLSDDTTDVKVEVEEVRSPESNAKLVGLMVKEAIEKRMPFRRVLKQTVDKVMANRDVQGVRIRLGGRLNGADMARTEEIKKGRIPLQTLRADIDFARIRTNIPQGVLGVKVWIYKGDIFEAKK